MRRGGPILLILVVIIVLLIAGVAFFALSGGIPGLPGGAAPTSAVPVIKIMVARQPINKSDKITDDLIGTQDMPQTAVTAKMVLAADKQLLIDKYAVADMPQGWPLSLDMVSDRPKTGGANVILPGQVAISMPIDEINLVGYAVQDGDHVDVIATTLFLDIDASFQSRLPNVFGQVVNIGTQPEGAPLAVLGMNNGSGISRSAGRAELDPTLNQVIYFIPSEQQRPRLVSQMILQDIQVLHVGTFPLAGESSDTQDTATQAAPSGGGPTAVPQTTQKPYMITLIVSPQDAVSLTYLLNSGTKLTFALRAPDDTSRAETEAATLQYLLSQYAIPVPAKLPYAIEPRMDKLPVFIEVTMTPHP